MAKGTMGLPRQDILSFSGLDQTCEGGAPRSASFVVLKF